MEVKKRAGYAIWACVFLLMLLIFPVGLVRNEAECASGGDAAYTATESLSEKGALQRFTAQYGYLQKLGIAFLVDDGLEKQGTLTVCILEADGKLFFQEEIPVSEIEDSLYYDITVKKRLKKGAAYQIQIQADGCADNIPGLYYTSEESQHTRGSAGLEVNGKPVNGQAVTRYVYEDRIGILNIACIWLFLAGAGFAALEWADKALAFGNFRNRAENGMEVQCEKGN